MIIPIKFKSDSYSEVIFAGLNTATKKILTAKRDEFEASAKCMLDVHFVAKDIAERSQQRGFSIEQFGIYIERETHWNEPMEFRVSLFERAKRETECYCERKSKKRTIENVNEGSLFPKVVVREEVDRYEHFHLSPIGVRMYGASENDIVRVLVEEEREKPTHWGYWDFEEERFSMIYEHRKLVEVCFGNGSEDNVSRGLGVVCGLKVKELETHTDEVIRKMGKHLKYPASIRVKMKVEKNDRTRETASD